MMGTMLRPSEVVKIIKQCGESGVKTLNFQGLELEFKVGDHNIVQPGLNFPPESDSIPSIPHVPHNPYSHASEPEDLGTLDLEDPFTAEHLMENGFDSDTSPDITTTPT